MGADLSPGRVGGVPIQPVTVSGDEVLAAGPVLDVLLAEVHEVVVVLDADDRVAYVSPGLEGLTGWRTDQVLGRPVAAFVAVDPDDVVRRIIHRSGEPTAGTRVPVTTPDGGSVELLVTASGPSELRDQGWWTVVLRPGRDTAGTVSALSQRVAFEDLQTRVASSFLGRATHEVDEGIAEALAEVGRFAGVDRAHLYQLDGAEGCYELAHEWTAPGVAPRPGQHRRLVAAELPRWSTLLGRREPIYLAGLASLGEDWAAEAAMLRSCGVCSALAVPVTHDDALVGFVGFDATRAERLWADDHVAVLQSLAGVVGQALVRRDAEQRFALAFEAAPLGMALLAPDGRHLQVNPMYTELTGRSPDALAGLAVTDLVHDDDGEVEHALAELAAGRRDRLTVEVRLDPDDGRICWVRLHVAAVRGSDGGLRHTVVHLDDVTERRRRTEEVQLSERRYRTLVEHGPALVARFDSSLELVYASPAVELLADEVLASGAEVAAGVGMADVDGGHPAGSVFDVAARLPWRELSAEVLGGAARSEREWELDLCDERRWFRSRAVAERGPTGEVAHVLVMTTDVSAMKRSEAELAHRSLHDPVTGLGNRELVGRRLREALASPERVTAVLMADLDRFKHINDSLGHAAGDELLALVADRLAALLPPEATLARLGGDEFVAIVDHVGDPRRAVDLADAVRAEVARPMSLAGTEVTTTASVGVAVRTPGRTIGVDLLRDADSAMYLAKARGRDRTEVCDDELRRLASERLTTEQHLRRSLDQGELEVHYQPEFDVATGSLVGAEALARWRHPDRGLLEAGTFIGLAEETGLIVRLGRWVLHEACRQAGVWQAAHGGPATIRVNVSARQLAEPDLVEQVLEALHASGLEPGSLCLEITETALMEDLERALGILGRLRDHGIRLAVDDFGTGYSSLAQLKRFPVDVLKIDRAFIVGLGRQPEDTAIVEAIVALAGSLGLEVVAEGVEDGHQLAELRRLGCHRAQGYLLSRPVEARVFGERLQSVG